MENQTKKRQVIINNPYEEPKQYHKRIANTTRLELTEGRRPAGYQFVKSQRESLDEKHIVTEYTVIEIELVKE